MKKVLALFALLLMVTSCVSKETHEVKTPTTKLELFVDSMKNVYPNYKGNITVAQKICDDFKQHLTTLPGILKDSPFHITGIAEIRGIKEEDNYLTISLHCDVGGLSIWCDHFDRQQAANIDNNKLYKITGGNVVGYKGAHGIAGELLDLGDINVSDLELTEIENN